MNDYKFRHTVVVGSLGSATGNFTHRVDVPFKPKYCIVRQMCADISTELLFIKAPFVQGGILGVINGDVNTFSQSYLKLTGSVQGSYEFKTLNVDNAIVDSSAISFGIVLEFVG